VAIIVPTMADPLLKAATKVYLSMAGLNDFDESIITDYQLDLWRLAISVISIA
jgi:uncharacterized protein (DUF2252 family)